MLDMEHNLKNLLLILTPILFFANLIQSFFYLPESSRREGASYMPKALYYTLFVLFFCAMIFALTATSLPLMWVAIEMTTLVSAPLIAFHGGKDGLEAMWKYLLICSIGIDFALFGTMLVLHSQAISSDRWFMAGFAFILAGYGTKTGLAPFHSWLPDAHSEAPAPVSALLSGALLNCSFFAIVRFREIAPVQTWQFCDGAMLSLGMLSLAVGAVFMVRQNDYKRLLAYSSVEHIGLITILYSISASLSDGKDIIILALFAHIVFHSLTKTRLFQVAGNILLAFGTRAVPVVQGLYGSMKGHAIVWLVGIMFICALPPSVLFFTELALVFNASLKVSVMVLVFLFIVFAAMLKIALSMTMGRSVAKYVQVPKRLMIVPVFLFVAILSSGIILSSFVVVKGALL
jgi:hydrogenase-4 component F